MKERSGPTSAVTLAEVVTRVQHLDLLQARIPAQHLGTSASDTDYAGRFFAVYEWFGHKTFCSRQEAFKVKCRCRNGSTSLRSQDESLEKSPQQLGLMQRQSGYLVCYRSIRSSPAPWGPPHLCGISVDTSLQDPITEAGATVVT